MLFWITPPVILSGGDAALSEGDALLLGECKYHASAPFSKREYEALAEKAGSPSFSGRDVAGFCLFSKTGFDPALAESLESDKSVYLFNECRLVRS